MRAEEAIQYLDDKEFLDKLYGFSYKRCSTSYEAQDLCADIVVTLIKSIRSKVEIEHFYAFAWAVAYRVYADFSQKRKNNCDRYSTKAYSDEMLNMQMDSILEYIENEEDTYRLQAVKREICFLSKIYRDVLVMYYLDEMSVYDIANTIGISENAVKQRLFSARKTIRKR